MEPICWGRCVMLCHQISTEANFCWHWWDPSVYSERTLRHVPPSVPQSTSAFMPFFLVERWQECLWDLLRECRRTPFAVLNRFVLRRSRLSMFELVWGNNIGWKWWQLWRDPLLLISSWQGRGAFVSPQHFRWMGSHPQEHQGNGNAGTSHYVSCCATRINACQNARTHDIR